MTKPIKEFSAGTCRASIWENEREKDGKKFTVQTVQLSRQYKDAEGNWKETNSYGKQDMANLLIVARAAQDFLCLKTRKPEEKEK